MDPYKKCAGQLLDLWLQPVLREPVFLRAATAEELAYFAKAGIVPIKVPPMKKPYLQELLTKISRV
jgi:hypothetical protein